MAIPDDEDTKNTKDNVSDIEESVLFLSDKLVGLVSVDIKEDEERNIRLGL